MKSEYYSTVKAADLKPGMQIFTGLVIETVESVTPAGAGWVDIRTDRSNSPIPAGANFDYPVVK